MAANSHRHHADEVLAVTQDASAAARSAVAASWIRSLNDYGLDPEQSGPPVGVDGAVLAASRERLAPLLRAAQSPLDRLFGTVGDAGCCVLLTDDAGVPLERRGAAADDDTFRAWGLWTGMRWDEPFEGTNGVGTCLAEGRPMTIHRDQHFYTRNIGLSCTVAPVHDHAGQIVGALDVSSCRRDLDAAMLGLIVSAVADTARRIEAANFRQVYHRQRITLSPDGDAGALLAIDRDDFVVGASRAARRLHGITEDQLAAGLPAGQIFGTQDDDEDLRTAERAALQRALARSGGNVTAAARRLGVSRATMHRKLSRLGLIKAD